MMAQAGATLNTLGMKPEDDTKKNHNVFTSEQRSVRPDFFAVCVPAKRPLKPSSARIPLMICHVDEVLVKAARRDENRCYKNGNKDDCRRKTSL